MAQKHKQTSDTERSLHEIRAGLLDKIVILQELLQQETFRRKNEMEEKHRLHLTNVKFEEENKTYIPASAHLRPPFKLNGLLTKI